MALPHPYSAGHSEWSIASPTYLRESRSVCWNSLSGSAHVNFAHFQEFGTARTRARYATETLGTFCNRLSSFCALRLGWYYSCGQRQICKPFDLDQVADVTRPSSGCASRRTNCTGTTTAIEDVIRSTTPNLNACWAITGLTHWKTAWCPAPVSTTTLFRGPNMSRTQQRVICTSRVFDIPQHP